MHPAGRGDPEPEFAWRPHLAGAARARGLPRRVAWPLRMQSEPAGGAPARSDLLQRSPDLQVPAGELAMIWSTVLCWQLSSHFCV